ncbi:hypothetical protein [Nocardia arthritidis]|uniref:Uncharacterized protein n=1 Tax=Nocardia arthritidis TaxID=228602 RepID=A0A6G9Y4I7_9NOCA|nr:hypothetical protein [Nocardia arthritidis]QIS08138.1 hypothetical protein F5544_01030 [Nocardia arthritidis]
MNQPGGFPPAGQSYPGSGPGQGYGQQPAPYPPQYGQTPAGNPYGAQPGNGPQFAPSGPQYGAPPQFGQPGQQFNQPGPQFGQPNGQFGQPPAQFGQQGGQFGQPNDPPGLTIDASYLPMSFMLALVKPKIRINGQPVPVTQWGPNHIPVGPGTYDVWVATPWMFDMGPAQTQVQVGPGQGTRVYYRTPALIFLKGAIGPVPQKTPGAIAMLIVFALLIVLIFLPTLLAMA